MSASEDAADARWEEMQVDHWVRHFVGVEVPDRAAGPSAQFVEPDEDEQFAAYMAQHFPSGGRV